MTNQADEREAIVALTILKLAEELEGHTHLSRPDRLHVAKLLRALHQTLARTPKPGSGAVAAPGPATRLAIDRRLDPPLHDDWREG